MAPRAQEPARKQLVHPVYLDPEILISLLATLEDGIYFSSEVAEKAGQTGSTKGEASGEAKLPGLASLLGLTLSASGKYARESGKEDSVENKFVRQHTAASLFNRLHDRLVADGYVLDLDANPDLTKVKPGDLVEVAGEFAESPVKKMIDVMELIRPFVQDQAKAAEEQAKAAMKAVVPGAGKKNKVLTPQEREVVAAAQQAITAQASTQDEAWRMVDLVKGDLEQSPVVDLALTSAKLSAMVTANRELLTGEVTAALMGGTFRLIGKVTAVDPRDDAQTLVVRRGAMGLMAESTLLPMIDSMNDLANGNKDISFSLPSGKVEGPYMQVIPLAIFI